jgi:hypothetical protein
MDILERLIGKRHNAITSSSNSRPAKNSEQTRTDPENKQIVPQAFLGHDVPVLTRMSGALRNGAPFRGWALPGISGQIQAKFRHATDGEGQMVAFLGAVLSDGLDAVEAACREAPSAKLTSSDVILNILARRREPEPPPTRATPADLELTCAPICAKLRLQSLPPLNR